MPRRTLSGRLCSAPREGLQKHTGSNAVLSTLDATGLGRLRPMCSAGPPHEPRSRRSGAASATSRCAKAASDYEYWACCLACAQFATAEHLATGRHLQRLATRVQAYPDKGAAAAS
eukprot:2956356-Lingulodinium_polyedra.AAC.1